MSELVREVVVEAVVDTAKLLPFLFATYLAMEALEHCASERAEAAVARAGRLGPVIGAVLGAVPQCGFSAMGATLFAGGVVSMGTLVAVMLSTSDEMVPVFLANAAPPATIASILALKVAVGCVAGVTVDAARRLLGAGAPVRHIHDLCERAHCGCDDFDCLERDCCHVAGHTHSHAHAHAHAHGHAHGRAEDGGRGGLLPIVRSALVHTAQVALFILAVSLVLGAVVEGVGTEALGELLGRESWPSVLLAGLVGLIPNCAASVALSQLYLDGALGAGALAAGLLSSAGAGLIVLWRTNASVRQNLAVTAVLYGVGVACGIAVVAAGVTF